MMQHRCLASATMATCFVQQFILPLGPAILIVLPRKLVLSCYWSYSSSAFISVLNFAERLLDLHDPFIRECLLLEVPVEYMRQ